MGLSPATLAKYGVLLAIGELLCCQSVLGYPDLTFVADAAAGEGQGGSGGDEANGGSSNGGGNLGGSPSGGSSTGGSSAGGASNGGSSAGGASTGGSSAGGSPGTLTPGDSTLDFNIAGEARKVIVHAPAAVAQGKVPLVIALHGNGDTNSNFLATVGLTKFADQDGFVVAAPQGIAQTFTYLGQTLSDIDWDAYRSVGEGNIDLPLLDALRTQLLGTGSIDEKRVLVFGYSQGGYLSFRYGMEAASVLSCSAVGAAANPLPGSGLVSQADRKIPVALQIGTNDWNISGARSTQKELQQNGNPLLYNEIQGAGHVPYPGDPKVPLDWCRGQVLP